MKFYIRFQLVLFEFEVMFIQYLNKYLNNLCNLQKNKNYCTQHKLMVNTLAHKHRNKLLYKRYNYL
jgi:hypothetical protein